MDPDALACAFPQWTCDEVATILSEVTDVDAILERLASRTASDAQIARYLDASERGREAPAKPLYPVIEPELTARSTSATTRRRRSKTTNARTALLSDTDHASSTV